MDRTVLGRDMLRMSVREDAEVRDRAVVGFRSGSVLYTWRLRDGYGVVMELEYQRLYLPPGTDRRAALTLLTMHAEFGDWELDRHRIFPDGSRRVVLRRRRRPGSLPG